MTVKKIIGKIHLWLGLSSGLVVFVIAITGCLYAFQAEIQNLTQPFRFVERQGKQVLPPSELKAVAEVELPGKHIHAVLYNGADRAAQVIFYSYDPEYYYLVYVNPYTAEVLEVKDMEADFFHFILDGHFYLWLPPEIGQPVAASATLVFVVMLISGIVLWWPRKKKDSRQRFTVKWKARWRRVNYDLHNVLGFYASAVALVLALTGLVWGFQWFAKGLYAAVGGEKSLVYTDPLSDTTKTYTGDIPVIDKIFYTMKQTYPDAKSIEVHIPESNQMAIGANANPEEGTYWKLDYRYYDQHTLREVPVDHIYGRFPEAKASDKLLRMNYDIHTGAILGLPGKILMFFASLICASLPVTGVYIWWGRRNKSRKEARKEKAKTGSVHVKKKMGQLVKQQA
ncbi:MAG TPA: PepSY-associated TM helix domain-containing protein [Ohtaekwangia sp.]|nr:PepSY-associated TM helix domain-containing protein [Ohtaekwangia sp.]